MPPRYAYWTILIDNKPTAFRSREAEELLPTLNQLRRKNNDVVMKWFARGRLWDTPEQAQWAGRNLKGSEEKRGKDWRPGGEHKDPRARFDKRFEKRDFGRDKKPRGRDGPASRRRDYPARREDERVHPGHDRPAPHAAQKRHPGPGKPALGYRADNLSQPPPIRHVSLPPGAGIALPPDSQVSPKGQKGEEQIEPKTDPAERG